ncbi:MAG TPA: arginine deiminase-related protein [Haliangiales bacterium]|nr:arginine deiminase-related protein [Haliangiales bacterium]
MIALALVRGVPSTFARAISARPPDVPIDVARARAQHAAYVAALRSLGPTIVEIPADDAFPDCVFVEDAAVVARGAALIARPGAASRRGEVDAVAAALAGRAEIHRMEAPATLDGGDVLRAGDSIYVGLSARTNAAGAARLAEVFGPRGLAVRTVELPPGVLHLKSVCSPLGNDCVLVAAGALPASTFRVARVLVAPPDEARAANAMACAGGALVAARCPETQALVEAAGLRVVPVDTSELAKADGALTCLSILVD